MDLARLESIAQQLVARVRDTDPHDNRRWLANTTTAEEREALLYVLAAAVPDTQRWSDLTAWCSGGADPFKAARQEMRRKALMQADPARYRGRYGGPRRAA